MQYDSKEKTLQQYEKANNNPMYNIQNGSNKQNYRSGSAHPNNIKSGKHLINDKQMNLFYKQVEREKENNYTTLLENAYSLISRIHQKNQEIESLKSVMEISLNDNSLDINKASASKNGFLLDSKLEKLQAQNRELKQKISSYSMFPNKNVVFSKTTKENSFYPPHKNVDYSSTMNKEESFTKKDNKVIFMSREHIRQEILKIQKEIQKMDASSSNQVQGNMLEGSLRDNQHSLNGKETANDNLISENLKKELQDMRKKEEEEAVHHRKLSEVISKLQIELQKIKEQELEYKSASGKQTNHLTKYSDSQLKLQRLKEKEILLSTKVTELLQNPMFEHKKQGFEISSTIETKVKELLEIKGQNGKLQLVLNDQEKEAKQLEEKITELMSSIDEKQNKIKELANIYTKVDIKGKFDEFLKECSRDKLSNPIENIYESLLASLEELGVQGNDNQMIKNVFKQKQTLIKHLKDFDIGGNDQNVKQVLLQSLKSELIQTTNELEYIKANQKDKLSTMNNIQPLFNHLNKLKAIYNYFTNLEFGTKNFDDIIKEQINGLDDKRFSQDQNCAFDKLPQESLNGLLFNFINYELNFNQMLINTKSEYQFVFILRFLNNEIYLFSGKDKKLDDINVEKNFSMNVYSKLDILKLINEKLFISVILEQEGRRRTIGGGEMPLKQLIFKYTEALKSKDTDLESRSLESSIPIYFKDLAAINTNEIGLVSCKTAIKSLFNEYFNNFLNNEILQNKTCPITLRLITGFNLDPSGQYYAELLIPKTEILDFKGITKNSYGTMFTDDGQSYKLKTSTKFGMNPCFDLECELEIDFGSRFVNLPIDIHIYNVTKEGQPGPALIGISKFVINKWLPDKKQVLELPLDNFDSNMPYTRNKKRSVLVAVYSKIGFRNDLKTFENYYNKEWFFETTNIISQLIRFKKERKELLLEYVFPKDKTNILPSEFLSSVLGTEEREIENHPLRTAIEPNGEPKVIFANKFEFMLYWKYLVHSENFWQFFKSEINNSRNQVAKQDKLFAGANKTDRMKEFEIVEKNFITNKHFVFVFFELQKENPKPVNLLEKLNDPQVTMQFEKPTETKSASLSETPKSITLPELITKIQTKIKEYKRENKLSDSDLIVLFDKNNDGLMQKDEFQNCLAELSISIEKDHLDLLFSVLDKDGSGSLTIVEIMKLMELEPREILRSTSNDKYFVNKYHAFRSDRIFKNYIEAIETYLRSNDLTFFQFFDQCKLIDEKSKSIREINFAKFIDISRNVVGLRELKSDDLSLIFKKIDKDGSQTLSFDEFCEFLDLKKIFEIVESSEFNTQVETCPFLDIIWSFAAKYKMTLEQLFAEIDDDKNGELSKQEMFVYFKNLFNIQKKEFNVKEFESFLYLAGKNKNQSIHLQDLKNILSAYELYKRTPKIVDKLFFEDLLLKLRDIIRTGRFRLKICFECEEEEKGIISVEKFRHILEESNKFMEEEIQTIINPISLPFTKFERVNYENFLNLCEFYETELREIEKSRDTSVVKVFKILKDISLKYNYDKFLLFSLLDKYNEGFITANTMCEVFKDIGLEFEEFAIHNSFKLIDTSEDGRIDMREFIAFMDEIK